MTSNGLYHPEYEKDACGIGLIASVHGRASRDIVEKGVSILKNLAHRGAQGADGATGDGAGLLIQIPRDFFSRQKGLAEKLRHDPYAVGCLFLPTSLAERERLETRFAEMATELGFEVLAWRTVPTNSAVLGAQARSSEPTIRQVFLSHETIDESQVEARLLRLRRRMELDGASVQASSAGSGSTFHIASLSSQTIVYKGLMLPERIAEYFPDLQNERVTSALALVHSRFSTNTHPAWDLAHPFRYLCHNGEINTIRGNLNWMKSRDGSLPELAPLVRGGLSDSASLDRAVELLLYAGYSLPEAMMVLIPEAWENNDQMPEAVRSFYRYHSSRMEPWDGPAAVAFTDGRFAGALLDRNGLRPCRFHFYENDLFVLSSEAGVLRDINAKVLRRGRLGPGKMIVVDTKTGRVLDDEVIKAEIATKLPYASWTENERLPLTELNRQGNAGADSSASLGAHPNTNLSPSSNSKPTLAFRMRLLGYTREEVERILTPMMELGEEPTSSMGNDTPPAILSDHPQLLFKYFRQNFAQVTNPPIDPIREKAVMSLRSYLGSRGDVFHRGQDQRRRVELKSPFLSLSDRGALLGSARGTTAVLKTEVFSTLFPFNGGTNEFRFALEHLLAETRSAARSGTEILVLSDDGIDAQNVALPSLLAVAAVHHALLRDGLRSKVSLVVDTGEARDVHQLACLIGYGADAVCPHLALELAATEDKQSLYLRACEKGLLKTMSKMGISSVLSYCGAQIFEALGIDESLIQAHFSGTPTRIGGLDLETLGEETLRRHAFALQREPSELTLPVGGDIHYRIQGENHLWDPSTIAALQNATKTNAPDSFSEFSVAVERASRATLRGHLKLVEKAVRVPIEEVEPASEIVKRFTTGAMSFGALGKEAHETLAVAMNAIGAKSNSGEGGEDADRFLKETDGSWKNSAIKQVASARFGVTAHYLVNAREIQIKISQGAKPGEGGQLPGHKVDAVIARMRHSTPGVTLISPPPHHDIYSIEDLAQLIHDLRSVNPEAEISVKLVAAPGIGTVAAGVAKALANKILISGDGGGTGASPLSSIKHAGSPWEIGLAEVQQTLVRHGLRSRVRLEADGQMRNGHDVIVAALLGAEEFGFSTAPLIVEGCIMMRKCHLNTCPVGVATQDPELRKKFAGRPEHVINYFFFVAEEVRKHMSRLGVRKLEELIGRSDLLTFRAPHEHWKARRLDLSRLLDLPECMIPGVATARRKMTPPSSGRAIESPLNTKLADLARSSLENGTKVRLHLPIFNTDRSIGASLAFRVARIHGAKGLPDETLAVHFNGSAGQSFGLFLPRGVRFHLDGEANDYVGKGLSGGTIAISPPHNGSSQDVIAGNTCLYGATSGKVFIAGQVGERFAVRNSGAIAVIEGAGDHACEYMTGGTVVVLGPTGRNFAAGMSGGVAYVHDADGSFITRCNRDLVELGQLESSEEEAMLINLLRLHVAETGSLKAAQILNNWARERSRFVRVMSVEYKKILDKAKAKRTATESEVANKEVFG